MGISAQSTQLKERSAMENSTFGQKSSDFKINGCQNKKEMKTGIEGIRSIQEAAIMTQSTDFSENRIK